MSIAATGAMIHGISDRDNLTAMLYLAAQLSVLFGTHLTGTVAGQLSVSLGGSNANRNWQKPRKHRVVPVGRSIYSGRACRNGYFDHCVRSTLVTVATAPVRTAP